MSDRLVRQVSPATQGDQAQQPFSGHLGQRNLVLLGDPGAGKTHLFRHFSAPFAPLRARDFLNTDLAVLRARKELFIDALDEKRAGRGDQNTIDAIVTKLGQLKPDKVRIACRAADWLGESDLLAFRGYFDHAGGVVVLSLEALTQEERIDVLTACGIASPESFLAEAAKRGLEELLSNPQNLIMLADVVRSRDWPKSRGELFKWAIELLLAEHNSEHSRQESGSFLPEELLEAAGAVCAARLIGDVDGICLANAPAGDGYPSYRSIRLAPADKVLATLGRRAFVAVGLPETVDYAHRTIAEYLAAHWLAQQLSRGLPLGRVRALIGHDGRPASELRGLHAWLAVLHTVSAPVLIDADPFGVLTYGDAASLSPTGRVHLLRAVARLSKEDPWFRQGDWSESSVAPLSGPDMTAHFREILKNDAAGYSLRSVVLDALSAGHPLPELNDELLRIVGSASLPYGERETAADALIKGSEGGRGVLTNAYPSLSSSPDDLRLRARILRRLSDTSIPAIEIVSLLVDALASPVELAGGVFLRLHSAVHTEDIPIVLNKWSEECSLDDNVTRGNASEVLHVVDDWLVRLLTSDLRIDASQLLHWLERRAELGSHDSYGSTEKLVEALRSRPALLSEVTKRMARELVAGEQAWSVLMRLQKLLVGAADNQAILAALVALLGEVAEGPRRVVYQTAMTCCFWIGPDARTTFEFLYSRAEGDPVLEGERATACYCTIPDWRLEQIEHRRNADDKRRQELTQARSDFERDKEGIANGTHMGWLSFIAAVYFARFSNFDRQVGPQQRLSAELGDQNAALSFEGLVAFVRNGKLSTVDEVIKLHVDGKYSRIWDAAVAGLDEWVDLGLSLEAVPEGYLRSALAIDLLHPTYRQEGNVSHRMEHAWKDWIVKNHPSWVAETYGGVARADLSRKVEHVYGTHELKQLAALTPFRERVAFELLEEFPCALPMVLTTLLPIVLPAHEPERLLKVVRQGIVECEAAGAMDSYYRWTSVGLMCALEEFSALVETLDSSARQGVFWSLRDLVGIQVESGDASLAARRLECFIRIGLRTFERAEMPESGWSGDTNDWDATRYLLKLIERLALEVSDEAVAALQRLAGESASFRDDIKHALATQRARRVDASFRQPTWAATLDALANGPPANVADLQALVLAHLRDLGPVIAASNTDIFKQFWNEDSHGRPEEPKVEESCRDVLVGLLRRVLQPHGVSVEPEGHMALDKRADIAIVRLGMKVVMELKRDAHPKVWSAIEEQLERWYIRDPEVQDHGIYGVFWFGAKRARVMPKPPGSLSVPQSAAEMQLQLSQLVPAEKRDKIVPVVIDVSGAVA